MNLCIQAFREYVNQSMDLYDLTVQGTDNIVKANLLRDSMDIAWRGMSLTEIEISRKFAASLDLLNRYKVKSVD